MFTILLFLLFLRPFISSPAFPEENAAYSFALGLFLILWFKEKKIAFPDRWTTLGLIVILLTLLFSLMSSGFTQIGAATLFVYLNLIILFLIIISFNSEDQNKLFFTLVLTANIVSIVSIYQFLFGAQFTVDYLLKQNIYDPVAVQFLARHRAYYPFITPNVLGGYLCISLFLCWGLKNKLWIIGPLIALLLSQSIGAFLSLIIACFLYAYLQYHNLFKSFKFFLLLIIPLFLFFIRFNTLEPIFHPQFSLDMRWAYWQETWQLIVQHPWRGGGIGQFDIPSSRYAHNSFLQIWAEVGLIGLLPIIFSVGRIFLNGLVTWSQDKPNQRKIMLLCAMTAFLVHNLMEFTLLLPETVMTFTVILGLLYASAEKTSSLSKSV